MTANRSHKVQRLWVSICKIGLLAFTLFILPDHGGVRAQGFRPILAEPRIPPLEQSDWTPEQTELLAPAITEGRVYNITSTVARHPDLYRAWLPFALHLLSNSTLPARHRELITLRVGWLCGSTYEFVQHTRLGRLADLTDEDIRRVTRGPDDPNWTPFERDLLRAVDELHVDKFISEATWEALAADYSQQQLMDLVFTVGEYTMVSMMLNTVGVPLDPGLPPLVVEEPEK